MKILTVNRNYFVTGGPEKYMFPLMENMPQHQFIPFSVSFEKNRPTPYERYFVDPPAGRDGVYYSQDKMGFFNKLLYAGKSVYSFEAKRKLEALIRDTRPEVTLFLNAVYFSDSIIDACRSYNVPIIWRMSDFHKVCACYLLYRNGKICEECLNRGLSKAVRYRCGGYQYTLGAAIIRVAGMWLSRYRRIYEHVNFFVTPSAFTREKMIQGGFAPEKIVHIPTFVEADESAQSPAQNPHGVLFVGRLSREKGIDQLIEAFGQLRCKDAVLTIAGDIGTEYATKLIDSIPDQLRGRIVFVGFQDQRNLARLSRENLLFVVPSFWYENQPNVLLEGMSHGRPAVVPLMGSFREIVTEGETGHYCSTGDTRELAGEIDRLLEDSQKAEAMGDNARRYVREQHSLTSHLSSLEGLFGRCR